MNTPICDFVREYEKKEALRLHMPGHKGKAVLGPESLDITEIHGADVLYQASGIIKESEENAAKLFGSALTLYSTEGSSLSIRAMLFLTKLYAKSQNERCVIVAARNAHKVFVNTAAFSDIAVEWLYPENEGSVIECGITAKGLESFLSSLETKPTAVYITSPDYLGNLADIEGISAVCKKIGCLLLVDNAHGAYLGFLNESRHPLSLGADLCCDSAHKTLPVLTGGGYLHVSKSAPTFLAENAARAMAFFASTSPSYIIMQSLDMANRYLSDGYREKLEKAAARYDALKEKLISNGFELVGSEPLKLTIKTKSYGYTGDDFAVLLEENGIVSEFSDPDFVVLMLSPEGADETASRLESVLLSIKRHKKIETKPPMISRCKLGISPHEALFAPTETVKTEQSSGRIMASATVSCPPAIPIVCCGEVIDSSAVEAMRYYGVEEVRVIRN